jgi:hypothetical protein
VTLRNFALVEHASHCDRTTVIALVLNRWVATPLGDVVGGRSHTRYLLIFILFPIPSASEIPA